MILNLALSLDLAPLRAEIASHTSRQQFYSFILTAALV